MIKLTSLFVMMFILALSMDRLFFQKGLESWREKLGELWKSISAGNLDGALSKLNVLICELFDYVYGKEHYSEKRLGRSIVSSLVGMFIFAYLFEIQDIYIEFMSAVSVAAPQRDTSLFVVIIILSSMGPIFFNLIPDYFSLVETRIVLQYARGKGIVGVLLLILVDIVFTVVIFLIGVLIYLLFINFISLMGSHLVVGRQALTIETFQVILNSEIGKVFLLTTFMTSFFWILFVLTFFTVIVLNRYVKFTFYLIDQLSRSEKPATIITTVFCAFVIILYTVVHLVF